MIEKANYEADTIDDLMRDVLSALLNDDDFVSATRSGELGDFTEIFGSSLVLKNPRARLSRSESKGKIFSALGEFLWYMSGNNSLDFIEYYIPKYAKESEDNIVVNSGYGDRLFERFGFNQIENILSILSKRPTSRQAVVQIFSASDLKHRFVPCTCTLQFILRKGRLSLLVNMRSNDAFLGLPHDVFAFTMIQEVIARALGVELGVYKHFVGSLHLYQSHRERAEAYLNEGWQNKIAMEPMPVGDPWADLRKVQDTERRIRADNLIDIDLAGLHDYWQDICVMLAIFNRARAKDFVECERLKSQLKSRFYHPFVDGKMPL